MHKSAGLAFHVTQRNAPTTNPEPQTQMTNNYPKTSFNIPKQPAALLNPA
jgi:hypothetical protein